MVQCFTPDCNHYSESYDCRFHSFSSSTKKEQEYKRWVKHLRQDQLSQCIADVSIVRKVTSFFSFATCMDCLLDSVSEKSMNSYLGDLIDVLESTLECAVAIAEMAIKATDPRFC